MLSREEMRQVERSLANSEQDTRDEIGFLLIHQGFADRFFPGTSVLHERIRYILFVPWLYLRAAENPRRGSDLESTIRHLLIELAIRLKVIGGEPKNVIGGEKLHQLTSQPPDRVYWSALRQWRILLPEVDSRAEVLRRLKLGGKIPPKMMTASGWRMMPSKCSAICRRSRHVGVTLRNHCNSNYLGPNVFFCETNSACSPGRW